MSQSYTPPPGLGVMILADDSPNATVMPDSASGEPSLRGFAGVVFIDRISKVQVDPPETFTVPHDYVDKHHWIEVVNPTAVVRAAGSAEKPYAKTHTFPHAEALVLHMADGDYRYRVVRQPDKYFDNGGAAVADVGGDPNTRVDWYYVVELEGKV